MAASKNTEEPTFSICFEPNAFYIRSRKSLRYRVFNSEEYTALKDVLKNFQNGGAPIKVGRHFVTSSEFKNVWYVGFWGCGPDDQPIYTNGLNIGRWEFDAHLLPQIFKDEE